MKIFVKILSIFAAAALLPLPSAFAETLAVNESFNGYATYEIPQELETDLEYCWVTEYKKGDKGLIAYGKRQGGYIEYSLANMSSVCISFDVMCLDNAPNGSLKLGDSSGNSFDILTFNSRHYIKTHNGLNVGGFNKSSMTNVSVVYRAASKTYDVYIDGKLKQKNYRAPKSTVQSVSSVKFCVQADSLDALIFDNINISDESKPRGKYPTDTYNPDEYDAIEVEASDFEPKLGSEVLVNETFDDTTTLTAYALGNVLEQRKEENGNGYMYVEKKVFSGDFHLNANNINSASDYVVYEFDIENLDSNSYCNVYLSDSKDASMPLGVLAKGSLWKFGSSYRELELEKWYRISVAIDYYTRKADYYINGEKVGSGALTEGFANGTDITLFRFHMTKYSAFGDLGDFSDSLKFMLDNIRVYDAKEPKTDLSKVERIIKLSDRSVFKSDKGYQKLLDGYWGMHLESGVLLKDGKKVILKNTPYLKDGTYMVPFNELAEKLGLSGSINNASAELGGKSAEIQNTEVKDEEIFVPFDTFFVTLLGKKVYKYDAQHNKGMRIIGDSMFTPGTSTDLDKLNSYLLFVRPDADYIREEYKNSILYGAHPRVQATAEDFARLRQECETNVYKSAWKQSVIGVAENYMDKESVHYHLPDGVRLLEVSREVDRRMYALGMAYQLTGDKKYADRAWLDLKAVSEFTSWHPGHALDVGEMASGVAVGYDWMYDAFTPEQRAVIEKGVYNNCFYDYNILYSTGKGAMSQLAIGDSNWNNICSGGVSLMSIAMMDVYPEISEKILSSAIRCIEPAIVRFAPDGAWYEGASYWELTMQYTAKILSGLQTVFGTSYGLDKLEGLSTAARYEIAMQSPYGIYSYGDSLEGTKVFCPEMLYIASHYNDPLVTKTVLEFSKGIFATGEQLAMALLWYDVNSASTDEVMPLDKYVERDGVITMRDSWNAAEQSFVGIHAGPTNTDHGHLDGGSFVFDSMGVRWARDLGMGDYNQTGYWEEYDGGIKWNIFRMRAEAHNCIVINPNQQQDQIWKSTAPVTKYITKPRGGIALVDTTELYANNASSARRGFFFTDNRQSLVVRDEIDLKKESDIYWFMITGSEVSVNGNTAILTQDGRRLKLEFVTDAEKFEMTCAVAKALPEAYQNPDDRTETAKRIAIKLHGSGKVNLTVKLTPADIEGTAVSDYNTSIDSWSVPDGAIPKKPEASAIYINGDEVIPSGNSVDYYYLEGTLTETPEIVVRADGYDVNVEKGATIAQNTKVTLTDRNDPSNKGVYSIIFHSIPRPKEFDGMESIPITTVTPSAEPQKENGAKNVLDGDLSTRWAADGTGVTLVIDTGKVQRLDNIAIAFGDGDIRKEKFSIAVSDNGHDFRDVFSGTSCGTTLEHEFFDLKAPEARYIRLTLNGNDSSDSSQWNSITEIVVTRRK